MKNNHSAVHISLLATFLSLLLLMLPTANAGEFFKCRSRTGQVLYSDVPCEKSGASLIGTVDSSPNEVDAVRRSPTEAPQGAVNSSRRAINSAESPIPKRPSQDVEARRVREHELKLILGSGTTTPEQKSAAQEELSSVAGVGVCKLNDDQRKRRDGAYADLGSLVVQRRAGALGVLREILNSCERV
ncbi:MAG: DUF4124 domain-containing protein [Burkholderiales bacterium]